MDCNHNWAVVDDGRQSSWCKLCGALRGKDIGIEKINLPEYQKDPSYLLEQMPAMMIADYLQGIIDDFKTIQSLGGSAADLKARIIELEDKLHLAELDAEHWKAEHDNINVNFTKMHSLCMDADVKNKLLLVALNPRSWAAEMYKAWHDNAPDIIKAFAALRKVALDDDPDHISKHSGDPKPLDQMGEEDLNGKD